MKITPYLSIATLSFAMLPSVRSWLPVQDLSGKSSLGRYQPMDRCRGIDAFAKSGVGTEGDDRYDHSFPCLAKKLTLLRQNQAEISRFRELLLEQGYCSITPGQTALMEFSNYFSKHANGPVGYVTIPCGSEILSDFIELANALHGCETFSECDIQITQWDGGVPAQHWHQDAPADRMVWVLTGYGEPTWFLEKHDSDQYCQIDNDNDISPITYECEPPVQKIKQGDVGKFIAFYGKQEEQVGQHALIHKGPGTIGSSAGRGTVRVVFR